MSDFFLPLSRKRTKRASDSLHRILVDWCGKENANNEIIPKLPPTQHISKGVEEAMKALLPPRVAVLHKIREAWHEIAGKQLAHYMTPSEIRDNTLFIEVSHPAWLMEFRKKEQEMLLKKIHKHVNCKECKKIKLIPTGRTRNVQRKN